MSRPIFEDLPPLTGRALPDSKWIEDYMGKLMLSDAYDSRLGLGPTFNEQLTNLNDGSRSILELDNCCIHTQFPDKSLVCKIIPAETKDDKGYDYGNTNDYTRYCKQGDTIFAEDLKLSHGNAKGARCYKMNMGREFSFNQDTTSQFLTSIASLERELFIKELDKQDYIHLFNEADLKKEIIARHKQYPNQPVYVFMGNQIVEYYQHLYSNNVNLFDSIGILASKTSSYYSDKEDRPEGKLRQYETAVVAQGQVRANATLHSSYRYERLIRKWKVGQGHYMKFALEVDKRLPPTNSNQMSMF